MPIIRSWALTRGFALHPGTRNRYEIRYTRTQHRPASRQVNDQGRVSGTHTAQGNALTSVFVIPHIHHFDVLLGLDVISQFRMTMDGPHVRFDPST